MNKKTVIVKSYHFFPNKSVVLRALDIGADKQLPYMPINEENPCLGWRGSEYYLISQKYF